MAEPIHVSADELRFLRRCFRRFALPYLILGIAVAVLAFALAPAHAPVDDSEEPAVQGLIAEAASLREAIALLRDDLEKSEARDAARTGRIDQLDRRLGHLAEQVADAADAPGDGAALSRIDEAHRRINALEARLAAAENHRRNALTLESGGSSPPPAAGGTLD
jgi:hypothetical protein